MSEADDTIMIKNITSPGGSKRYAQHSPITDPGTASERLADLPTDIDALRQVARGLVIHYRAEDPSAHGILESRLPEIDTRYAEKILERLFDLDGRPLTEERPPKKRILGCCRDFTVLFLTMARHMGISARARVGFATYFLPDFNLDHEIAEVWDSSEGRWRLVDVQLGDEHVDETDGATFDPLDVPRDRFLVAGAAWKACRAGEADPEKFLVSPDLDVEMTRGWPYLRHNLIHDLAALNKQEMILWDYWGLANRERLTEEELALVDRVAQATISGDASFPEVRALYEGEPELRVPPTVTSYSPAYQESLQVKLDTPVPPTRKEDASWIGNSK